MLDSDLARLYATTTGNLNREYYSLKPQNATSKGGSRKVHTVFTEQGVAMLSTSLKSIVAINT